MIIRFWLSNTRVVDEDVPEGQTRMETLGAITELLAGTPKKPAPEVLSVQDAQNGGRLTLIMRQAIVQVEVLDPKS